MAEAVRDAESTRENPDGSGSLTELRPSVISWRCGPKDPTRQPARHAFCCMRKPERKAQVWRLRYTAERGFLSWAKPDAREACRRRLWSPPPVRLERSPARTESEWLPFTLDNSMLTPCSGGSERHRFACCSHADLRQWIAGRDKWERLSSTGGENCGQQGIRDFKDLVPPVAPTGTPGVNGLSGWKGLACFCSGP